jgi:hypothetical protein
MHNLSIPVICMSMGLIHVSRAPERRVDNVIVGE